MSWLWVGPWQWTATPPAVKETTTLAGLTSLLAALKRFEPKNAARNGLRRAPEMLQAAFGTPNHKPLLGALILVMQRIVMGAKAAIPLFPFHFLQRPRNTHKSSTLPGLYASKFNALYFDHPNMCGCHRRSSHLGSEAKFTAVREVQALNLSEP